MPLDKILFQRGIYEATKPKAFCQMCRFDPFVFWQMETQLEAFVESMDRVHWHGTGTISAPSFRVSSQKAMVNLITTYLNYASGFLLSQEWRHLALIVIPAKAGIQALSPALIEMLPFRQVIIWFYELASHLPWRYRDGAAILLDRDPFFVIWWLFKRASW
jgi:hypothetical protein